VYSDTVELPDGRTRDRFHHIVLPEYAITCAITPERRFVMVREYKHGAARICLNAPAGRVEDGEEPLAGAQRELLEETGFAADEWRALGAFVVDASTGCSRAHVFLARNARPVAAPHPDELEEIDVVLLEENGLRAALAAGEIVMMPTACALALALLALRN